MIKIWIDSSYSLGSGRSSWGAVFDCPFKGERIKLSGTSHGVKSSTHAEILGVYEALVIVFEMYPKNKFEARLDCKSIVDLFERPSLHRTSNLEIGRVLRKINNEFGEILNMTHVPGHAPRGDKTENAARNREAHNLAHKLNKKERTN